MDMKRNILSMFIDVCTIVDVSAVSMIIYLRMPCSKVKLWKRRKKGEKEKGKREKKIEREQLCPELNIRLKTPMKLKLPVDIKRCPSR